MRLYSRLYSCWAYFCERVWFWGCFGVCWCVNLSVWLQWKRCFIRKRVFNSNKVFLAQTGLYGAQNLTLQKEPNGEVCSSVAKAKSKVCLLPPTGEWERKQTLPLSSCVIAAAPYPWQPRLPILASHRRGDPKSKGWEIFWHLRWFPAGRKAISACFLLLTLLSSQLLLKIKVSISSRLDFKGLKVVCVSLEVL